MRRHWRKAVAIGISAAAIAAVGLSSQTHGHIGPANLYPDPSLTPGLLATFDFNELTAITNGLTYSKNHRQTSSALKAQIHSEYPDCPAPNEIDHYIPLALGGADDAKNLWCESDLLTWNGVNYGFHVKDSLENYLVIQMKAGNISPIDAQNCIQYDWIACYQQYKAQISATPKYGSIAVPSNYNGDDDTN